MCKLLRDCTYESYYETIGEGNWVEIETGDAHHREPVCFYAWEVYCGSNLFVIEIDGEILKGPKRFTYGFHWFGKGVW